MTSSEGKTEYRQYIPIEGLVASQINRIMEYRSKRMPEHYIESIEGLIDLLPPDIEETVLKHKNECGVCFGVAQKNKDEYVDLFRFIKKQLTECNIVWKRSGGYEIGHD